MAYKKQNFVDDQILTADHLNYIEDGIIVLDNKIDQFRDNLSNGTVTSNLPSYWKNRLDTIGEKIEALQMENGMDTLQFLWCSDIHSVPGTSPSNTTYIGQIGRYMMDKHNIPFFIASGDIMSQGSHANTSSIWAEYDKLIPMLAPIKNEEFLAVKGNHDGAYGSPMEYNGQANQYYHSYIGDKALFNPFMRRQTLDSHRRVFSKNGMYFYVDYHDFRIYMLNTHTYGDNSVNEQGQAVFNGFKHDVFGSEQLQWIADSLNNVKENQQVIFIAHAPINYTKDQSIFCDMVSAYKNRTTINKSMAISDTYWGNGVDDTSEYKTSKVVADFTNAKGQICAWFNGHIHNDSATGANYFFPTFSITCAGGDVRDAYYTNGTLTRAKGTATETAIDLVTITSEYIYCTRIGSGYDRKYNRLTKEVTIDYDSAYIPPTESEPEEPEIELTQGEITSEVTWQANTRLSSSTGGYSSQTDIAASSDIPVKPGDIIRIYGFIKSYGYSYVNGYKNGEFLLNHDVNSTNPSEVGGVKSSYDTENDIFIIEIKETSTLDTIRVCNFCQDTSAIRVFRNAELEESEVIYPSFINLRPADISDYVLNKKYSGTSIVDGGGYYLTPVYTFSGSITPYLNVEGVYGAGANISEGITLYKVAFYKGLTCMRVEYTSNMGLPSGNNDQQSIDISSYVTDKNYDGIQLSFAVIGKSTITINDIPVDGSVKATLSNTAEHFTLAVPNSTNTTNTDIWVNNYRFSSSGLSAEAGTSVSNIIPIQKGCTIKISGVTLREGQDRVYIGLTTSSGLSGQAIAYFNNGASSGGVAVIEYKGYSDGVYTFYIPSTYAGIINYFRFAMPTPTNFNSVVVTVEGLIIESEDITDKVTWNKDKRLSSSSGNYSDLTGSYASSDIFCKNGDIIRLYNVSKGTNYDYVAVYDSSFLGSVEIAYDDNNYSNTYFTATRRNGVTTIIILDDRVEYIRVCSNGGIDPSTVRITKNMELSV